MEGQFFWIQCFGFYGRTYRTRCECLPAKRLFNGNAANHSNDAAYKARILPKHVCSSYTQGSRLRERSNLHAFCDGASIRERRRPCFACREPSSLVVSREPAGSGLARVNGRR